MARIRSLLVDDHVLFRQSLGRLLASEADVEVVADRGTAQVAEQKTTSERPHLTDREQAVLQGVFEGLANKEIGARLGVSESAVKATLQQLFRKTSVRTRSQLVRVALEGSLPTTRKP